MRSRKSFRSFFLLKNLRKNPKFSGDRWFLLMGWFPNSTTNGWPMPRMFQVNQKYQGQQTICQMGSKFILCPPSQWWQVPWATIFLTGVPSWTKEALAIGEAWRHDISLWGRSGTGGPREKFCWFIRRGFSKTQHRSLFYLFKRLPVNSTTCFFFVWRWTDWVADLRLLQESPNLLGVRCLGRSSSERLTVRHRMRPTNNHGWSTYPPPNVPPPEIRPY